MFQKIVMLISGGFLIFLMGCEQKASAPNRVERGKYLVNR